MPSWSQKIDGITFPDNFDPGIFGGGLSRYAAPSLIISLFPGHSDITTFRPWSPIATGNNLDRA